MSILHEASTAMAQLEHDAELLAGTPVGDSLAWARDEIRRLRTRERELDDALSTAEWRLSQPPS